MTKLTFREWQEEMHKRFGSDTKKWSVICPSCETVQSVQDFIDLGLSNERIQRLFGFSCIGRIGESKKGCKYTLGGLLKCNTLELQFPDGSVNPVFDFAPKEIKGQGKPDDIKTLSIKDALLLPPPEDCCQVCGVKHPKHYPHNKDSLYYQVNFKRKHDRYPTWDDAMEHCDDMMKTFWRERLAESGEN